MVMVSLILVGTTVVRSPVIWLKAATIVASSLIHPNAYPAHVAMVRVNAEKNATARPARVRIHRLGPALPRRPAQPV